MGRRRNDARDRLLLRPALPPLPVTIKPATPWNTTLPTSDVPPGTAANSAYNPGRESDAWQLPCQWIIARPVTRSRYLPRLRSGANRIVRSSGMERTIFSAFDDVQM